MLLDCCAAKSPMSKPSRLSMEPFWPISMAGKDGGRSLELRLSACRAWLWYGICICTKHKRSQACDRLRSFQEHLAHFQTVLTALVIKAHSKLAQNRTLQVRPSRQVA